MNNSLLPINEIFQTVQGEGTFTGRPSIFIRTQGCAVGCPWCDTKHTWAVDKHRQATLATILDKQDPTSTWAPLSVDVILSVLARFKAKHVVITGGEPCEHNLLDLTEAICTTGRSVQIETSGTRVIRVDLRTWVTLSPKFDMPGGFGVRDDAIERADEIKMPVGKPADIQKLVEMIERRIHQADSAIFLQPLSLSEKAMALCVEAATHYDWRVSPQVHALAGWR